MKDRIDNEATKAELNLGRVSGKQHKQHDFKKGEMLFSITTEGDTTDGALIASLSGLKVGGVFADREAIERCIVLAGPSTIDRYADKVAGMGDDKEVCSFIRKGVIGYAKNNGTKTIRFGQRLRWRVPKFDPATCYLADESEKGEDGCGAFGGYNKMPEDDRLPLILEPVDGADAFLQGLPKDEVVAHSKKTTLAVKEALSAYGVYQRYSILQQLSMVVPSGVNGSISALDLDDMINETKTLMQTKTIPKFYPGDHLEGAFAFSDALPDEQFSILVIRKQ
jgi:hypothetical protein